MSTWSLDLPLTLCELSIIQHDTSIMESYTPQLKGSIIKKEPHLTVTIQEYHYFPCSSCCSEQAGFDQPAPFVESDVPCFGQFGDLSIQRR